MKKWGIAIVSWYLILLAGCQHYVPVVDTDAGPPPAVKKVPLKAAILISNQMEAYTVTGQDKGALGTDGLLTLTYPLGRLVKKGSLEIFPYFFEQTVLTRGQPYPSDADIVIIPTIVNFYHKFRHWENFASSCSHTSKISIKIVVMDTKGTALWQGVGVSPEVMKSKPGISEPEWYNLVGEVTYESVVAALSEAAMALARSREVQNFAAAKIEPAVIAPGRPTPAVITKPLPEDKLPLSRNQFAVVIGISNYKNPKIQSLKYTKNDALSVYKWLLSPKGGGYPEKNIELLIDQQANLVNIRTALGTWLARRALKNDTVFIFYAGHGAPEPDAKSDDGYAKYLVPYDADPDNLYATALPMKEMADIFDRIEAERIIFVADACYSGASGGRTLFRPGSRAISISSQFLDQLSQAKGRVVITASDTNEVSGEVDDLHHGIFTYYLLEALDGKADTNNDGVVDLREAYEYLYEKVARHSKLAGFSQHPVWKGDMRGRILLGVTK